MRFTTYEALFRDISQCEDKLDNLLLYYRFVPNPYNLPIIVLKDNSVLILFAVTGIDYESLSPEEKSAFAEQIRNALEQLGPGYTISNYFERIPANIIKLRQNGETPAVIRFIQSKKQEFWEGISEQSYSNRIYCSLKYSGQTLLKSEWKSLFNENHVTRLHQRHIDDGIEKLQQGYAVLKKMMARFGVCDLALGDAFALLYRLINRQEPPAFRPDLPLDCQLAHSNYEFNKWSIAINDEWFMNPIAIKYPPLSSLPVMLQQFYNLNFPFIIKQSFSYERYDKLEKRLLFDGNIARSLTRFDRKNVTFLNEIESFNDLVKNEKQLPMRWALNFYVYANSRDKLKENTIAIMTLLKELGSFGIYERYNSFNACLGLFPGHEHFTENRSTLLLTQNAGDFFNAYRLYEGDADPVNYYIDRNNTIFAYNPFAARENAHHLLITGPTGSGKSFFMNNLLASSLVNDPYIYVIDLSGSFRELFALLQAEMPEKTTIVTVSNQKIDFQLNPFYIPEFKSETHVDDKLVETRIRFCEGLIRLLVGEKWTTDANRLVVRKSLEQFMRDYRSLLRNSNDAPQPPFDILLPIIRHNSSQRELPDSLEYWTRGEKGKLFNSGKDTLKTARYCYFDLKNIESNKEEMLAIIYCIFDKIIRDISNENERKVQKFILFDEAHRYLREDEFSFHIDQLIRTGRHFNLLLGLITQSVNDIISEHEWSKGIITNVQQAVFFGGQKNIDHALQQFQMNDYHIQLYKNLKTYRREFLYWSASGLKRILTPLTDPYTYWLATTEPNEKHCRDILKQAVCGGDTKAAIELCVNLTKDCQTAAQRVQNLKTYIDTECSAGVTILEGGESECAAH